MWSKISKTQAQTLLFSSNHGKVQITYNSFQRNHSWKYRTESPWKKFAHDISMNEMRYERYCQRLLAARFGFPNVFSTEQMAICWFFFSFSYHLSLYFSTKNSSRIFFHHRRLHHLFVAIHNIVALVGINAEPMSFAVGRRYDLFLVFLFANAAQTDNIVQNARSEKWKKKFSRTVQIPNRKYILQIDQKYRLLIWTEKRHEHWRKSDIYSLEMCHCTYWHFHTVSNYTRWASSLQQIIITLRPKFMLVKRSLPFPPALVDSIEDNSKIVIIFSLEYCQSHLRRIQISAYRGHTLSKSKETRKMPCNLIMCYLLLLLMRRVKLLKDVLIYQSQQICIQRINEQQ